MMPIPLICDFYIFSNVFFKLVHFLFFLFFCRRKRKPENFVVLFMYLYLNLSIQIIGILFPDCVIPERTKTN